MMIAIPPDDGVKYVTLPDGTRFPQFLQFLCSYEGGPHFSFGVEVREGRPVVASIGILSKLSEPEVTPSMLHAVPFGQLIEYVMSAAAAYALQRTVGRHRLITGAEITAAGAAATAALRGRPVRNEELERVAEIVRRNKRDPRNEIKRELHVSVRTASRYIAEARRRGLLNENEED